MWKLSKVMFLLNQYIVTALTSSLTRNLLFKICSPVTTVLFEGNESPRNCLVDLQYADPQVMSSGTVHESQVWWKGTQCCIVQFTWPPDQDSPHFTKKNHQLLNGNSGLYCRSVGPRCSSTSVSLESLCALPCSNFLPIVHHAPYP